MVVVCHLPTGRGGGPVSASGAALCKRLLSSSPCHRSVRSPLACALPELFAVGCLLFSSLAQMLPLPLPSTSPLLRINLGALRAWDVILLSWLLCLCFWLLLYIFCCLPGSESHETILFSLDWILGRRCFFAPYCFLSSSPSPPKHRGVTDGPIRHNYPRSEKGVCRSS